ncbi:MAG: sensor histidine kinase [Puia sp.]|nr:sensor histidine kinase [Puia sp.]
MNKRIVQIIIHLAAWTCFISLPFVFYPRPRDVSFFTEKYFSLFFIINNLLLIGFYYLNTVVLIPRLLEQKKLFAYIGIILCLLIIYGCVPRIYHYLSAGQDGRFFSHRTPPAPGQAPHPHEFRPPLLSAGSISIFLLVFVFSTGVKVINHWLRSEQRNKEIANEKLNAELSFLKAQINPHFLFNTLNNIYSLATNHSDQTAAAIMKLSNIMRYVLTEAKNDQVPLEKEIQFISHYIELQKMRLTDKSSVSFTIQGDTANRTIAPLLFLPFVENAFKYGVSTREASPIHILLEITGNLIYFKVVNGKHINTTLKMVDNTGIGINNTRRRLDLLYPGKHTLTIADEASTFTVHLNIHL